MASTTLSLLEMDKRLNEAGFSVGQIDAILEALFDDFKIDVDDIAEFTVEVENALLKSDSKIQAYQEDENPEEEDGELDFHDDE